MHRIKLLNLGTAISQECNYCHETINGDNFLVCIKCSHGVHISCLRHGSTPGDLLGDVFFDFTCAKCVRKQDDDEPSTSTSVAYEHLVRQRVPWLLIITIALYNLSIKAKGISHHGYFHWRTHIINFIDKNWEHIFEPNTRRRKNWIGSVSGALSHNSPEFFLSGQEVFNEHGWWKLTHANQTPRYIYSIYEKMCLKRQQMRIERRLQDENSCGSDFSANDGASETKRMRQTDSSEEQTPAQSEGCARTIPYMGRQPMPAKAPVNEQIDDDLSKQQPLSTVQTSLMDFLAETLVGDDLFNHLPNIAPEPLIGVGKHDLLMSPTLENANFFDEPELRMESLQNELLPADNVPDTAKLRSLYTEQQSGKLAGEYNAPSSMPSEYNSDSTQHANDAEDSEDENYQPRIVQITNFQQQLSTTEQEAENPAIFEVSEINEPTEANTENAAVGETLQGSVETQKIPPCKPSLFKKEPRRNWPWLVERNADAQLLIDGVNIKTEPSLEHTQLSMLSLYEEQHLLQKLEKIFAFEQQCQLEIPAHIRRFYRKLCVRKWKREHNRPVFNLDEQLDPNYRSTDKTQILDRYQLISSTTNDARKSFFARIAGSSEHEMFESPYTQRILHPFIYRSKTTYPPWLKLMCELKHKVNGVEPARAPIDYCYVRPHHIAAVNALLQTVFWPGIDMSECLSYPDYSVVAMYKKLVIGCGFLVPDVGFNEAYISFMAVRPAWERSGISTFMLYHLIQTCMSKDITLHVSATNPAVLLYQKFGFKIEEVIQNFYDKYLPIDSKHSRHAFFLRLMR